MRNVLLGLILSGMSNGLLAVPSEKIKEKGPSNTPKEKQGSSTTVNFDEENVGGKRRDPLGSIINRNQAEVKTNLIQLRIDWNDEINDSFHYIGQFPSLEMP